MIVKKDTTPNKGDKEYRSELIPYGGGFLFRDAVDIVQDAATGEEGTMKGKLSDEIQCGGQSRFAT